MSFAIKAIADLPFKFLNSSFCSISQTHEEEKNPSMDWGVFILTVCASFYLARVFCWERRELKKIIFEDFIKNPYDLSKLQQAVNGTAKVYLGHDFVIKQCGDKCSLRATRTLLANSAIQNNKYLHLKIPKIMGMIGEEYIAEERLPIYQSGKEAASIYENHRDAFTPAVKEFVNLLIRCKFTDILQFTYGPMRLKTPIPRYDNICPYLEKGEGTLGLVDLEHFEENGFCFEADKDFGVEVKYCNKENCAILVHLFPMHLEEIIEVMQEAGLHLSKEDLQELRSVRENQLEQRRADSIEVLSSME